jgi:hypothetical protein
MLSPCNAQTKETSTSQRDDEANGYEDCEVNAPGLKRELDYLLSKKVICCLSPYLADALPGMAIPK